MTRTRRLLIAFAAPLLLTGTAAAWWLTRRPMTYEARATRAESASSASLAQPSQDVEDFLSDAGRPGPDDLGGGGPPPGPVSGDPDPSPGPPAERAATPGLADAESYLLIGVDHTRGRWGRADSIVVAFFDDETGHVGVVSIPRDLHVDVPGHGPARINATLRIATRSGDDPLERMREVVGAVLDAPIDHVVVADLEAFERTVDGLGGLPIHVPCAIEDDFIDPRAPGGRRLLSVEAGIQPMNGATAAMYVRSRHGRSDWDRSRRQQAVLAGLRGRLRELGPTGWIPVVGEALESGVFTSMSRLELLGLARRVSRLAPERTHGVLIGTRQTTSARTEEGRYVLTPDYAAIDLELSGLFEAPSPGVRPERKRCPDSDVALRPRGSL